MSSVLVVGSVALDSVKTTTEQHDNLLGGSASYASVAASFWTPVNMVGIVGEDFPQPFLDLFAKKKIDTMGLQRVPGKTFAWSGEYEQDMNNRRTLSVELNVFEYFQPILPEAYRQSEFVLLANIAPKLQSHVLDQMSRPKFVIADTMDLWINIAREDLCELLKRVDMLILNDSEAKQLTGCTHLISAGAALQKMGPKYVAIKKGEHGCLLFGDKEFFAMPAYPIENLKDPTGAGDCFAGGTIGFLAAGGEVSFKELKRAIVCGSIVASINVESFSLKRLEELDQREINLRYKLMKEFTRFE